MRPGAREGSVSTFWRIVHVKQNEALIRTILRRKGYPLYLSGCVPSTYDNPSRIRIEQTRVPSDIRHQPDSALQYRSVIANCYYINSTE